MAISEIEQAINAIRAEYQRAERQIETNRADFISPDLTVSATAKLKMIATASNFFDVVGVILNALDDTDTGAGFNCPKCGGREYFSGNDLFGAKTRHCKNDCGFEWIIEDDAKYIIN